MARNWDEIQNLLTEIQRDLEQLKIRAEPKYMMVSFKVNPNRKHSVYWDERETLRFRSGTLVECMHNLTKESLKLVASKL